MERVYARLWLALALTCALNCAEAKTSMRRAPKDADLKVLQVKQTGAEKAHISPELEPKSSSKFFEKDYPFDKRPKADTLHFSHPYPVVQDSSEFDRDFVKDENSDNGSWKAQETYDRLRVKLAKEKRDLAKALSKKTEEENELRDALKRHEKGEKAAVDAAAKAKKIREEQDRKKKEEEAEEKEEAKKPKSEKAPKTEKDKAEEPKAEEPKTVEVSTKETEEAMKSLEECKKQLAEARQRLKDLMKELEEAKATQTKANKVLDEKMQKELTQKEYHSTLKKKVKSEYEDYQAAREAYLKQQALVEKLEGEIKEAAEKVKAIRDSADADGGVYPTRDDRHSGAAATHWMFALVLALVATCSA